MAGRGRGRGRGSGSGSGRGRKQTRLLSETNEDKDQVSGTEQGERKIEYEFPTVILEVIISLLTLRDLIRASAVCKTWLDAAISVRNCEKPPLLMIFPKFSGLYEFYDPSNGKSYWLKLWELHRSKFCYAKDGWLLMVKPRDGNIFLFSPYTRETVGLPDMDFRFLSIAFSAAPTSPNCFLFAIKKDLNIATCRPGDTKWTTVNYQTSLPSWNFWDKFVFYGGLFYCLKFPCRLGIYNPDTVTWTEYSIPPPCCSQKLLNDDGGIVKHLIEHHGDVYVVVTYSDEDPQIFKLDLTNKVTSNIETLGGITLFANGLSTLVRTDLRTMRNQVYFPKVQKNGKHCISYSLEERRYYPRNERYDWSWEELPESIWIEPPENLLVFSSSSKDYQSCWRTFRPNGYFFSD